VSDWFAGREQLTGEQALAIQDFLKKQTEGDEGPKGIQERPC